MITRFIAIASLILNGIFVFTTMQMWSFYLQKTPFDMSAVRDEFRSEAERLVMNACITGTDYPPEFRRSPSSGWNENNPADWCGEKRDSFYIDWIDKSAERLGRKK